MVRESYFGQVWLRAYFAELLNRRLGDSILLRLWYNRGRFLEE